eukprot:Amastigsp_a842913_191.p3 type:complete len:149 gc:universal Amastigsp_a842913_191:464-18(-)
MLAVQEKSRAARLQVQVRLCVLRHASLRRRARVHLRLSGRGARALGESQPCRQRRKGVAHLSAHDSRLEPRASSLEFTSRDRGRIRACIPEGATEGRKRGGGRAPSCSCKKNVLRDRARLQGVQPWACVLWQSLDVCSGERLTLTLLE